VSRSSPALASSPVLELSSLLDSPSSQRRRGAGASCRARTARRARRRPRGAKTVLKSGTTNSRRMSLSSGVTAYEYRERGSTRSHTSGAQPGVPNRGPAAARSVSSTRNCT
jgi:hypothetical protein